MKMYKGRPLDSSDRLEKEIQTYDYLDRLGIEYYRVDHQKADTMEDLYEVDEALNTLVCKNLFLCNRSETKFYLLMMPGYKVFKTRELSGQIGSSRLSFAKPEFLKEYLNLTPGSVSIMGLIFDKGKRVQLLIDKEVVQGEYIGCHPCINTSSIKVRTKDILERYLKEVEHIPMFVDLTGE